MARLLLCNNCYDFKKYEQYSIGWMPPQKCAECGAAIESPDSGGVPTREGLVARARDTAVKLFKEDGDRLKRGKYWLTDEFPRKEYE